ncbi:DUF2177 family protein [Candidatus Viadribacter manganicus]|uniref:DUF2177 domain-containing protein n=1 Tax=Candidatus Viadribacter manganicus TaxID=1759059 RepID=A0A1B1AKV5_9PROT|nr:DUF2177 family protein [Candidatus Viadribacter manganicus]ANP47150.1 hypothetical protein ATE48_15115 [Candidatus Viadribacter manganicus]
MLAYLIGWVVAAGAFLGLDALWFSQMVPRFYRPIIGTIMRPQPNLTAAAAFYLIYVSAIMFFAVAPGLAEASVAKAMTHGAVFGFVAYATFDLSNHAIMRAWSTKLTLVDMAWGTLASSLTAGAAYTAASALS